MTALQRGDVIELGRHRLMCGDAFSAEDRTALLQGVKPDMLYCDPPYGMKLKTDFSTMKPWKAIDDGRVTLVPGRKGRGKKYATFAGDNDAFDPSSLIGAFSSCKEQFWWGADYYAERIPNRSDGAWMVWDKRDSGKLDKMFGSSFELCWSRHRHKRDIVRGVMWAGMWGTQWEPEHKRVHPTQKPIKLAEWFLSRYSKEHAAILDLFAGSGSTLLACERLNRTGYVMEISPDYCQVIIDRYEAMRDKARLPLLDGVAS